MKAIRIFFRSIRDSFKSIGRNFSLSLASILCDTITLIIFAAAFVIAANINKSTKSIEEEMNIVVYLERNASTKDAENLLAELKSYDNVKEVEYISKDEQKIQMSEYSESFETILNYLDENPLLDSYIVYVDDVTKLTDTAKGIMEITNVETVKYGEGMVDEVIGAFDIIEKVAIGLVCALIFVTGFLISNTIKLTIYSRRNEIEIMRLVGASNFAIKLPFIFEGLFIGLIGSIIPICITIYGYVILYDVMGGYIFTEMLHLINPYNFVFIVSGFIVAIGALDGMFGSAHAVRKYLKI